VFPSRTRSAFTLPKLRARFAFTLIELLVVIGIIAILLVAVIPAVNSLSKSSGRKAAISNLLGAIEQARAEAIRTGQATYVVFPTFGSASPTSDRYNYKSYAIWADDPATTPASQKQLTNWKTLPAGVAIRSKPSSPESLKNLSNTSALFKFTPDSNVSASFYYIKFNANGEVELPNSNITLAIFEGYVDATTGSEVITGGKDSFSPPNPLATEAINISRLTGRAEPTATATPTS
jgi:prepilin-type N-terminal cleavage/methylation domain-containing protein